MLFKHPVFVYGSLMHGLVNHRLIEESPDHFKFGGAYQTVQKYLMSSLGAFPGINSQVTYQNSKYYKNSARVIGELYWASPEGRQLLDHLEGHPSFYKRTSTHIRPLVSISDREHRGANYTKAIKDHSDCSRLFSYNSRASGMVLTAEVYELNPDSFFSDNEILFPNLHINEAAGSVEALSWPHFLGVANR